jgi:hypothetical protein
MQNSYFRPECTISEYQNLWSIHSSPSDRKMMFGSVSEHFTNPQQVKDENSCFGPECNISVFQSCEASILVHWTQNDVWSVSEHFANPPQVKEEKLMFRARMQYFGAPKLWSIYSSPLDPKWCLRVFQSISLTFGTWKMQSLYVGPECNI